MNHVSLYCSPQNRTGVIMFLVISCHSSDPVLKYITLAWRWTVGILFCKDFFWHLLWEEPENLGIMNGSYAAVSSPGTDLVFSESIKAFKKPGLVTIYSLWLLFSKVVGDLILVSFEPWLCVCVHGKPCNAPERWVWVKCQLIHWTNGPATCW